MTLLPAALPRLRGFWLWGFRAAFAAAFFFALFAAVAATWYEARPDSGKLAAWGTPLGLGVRISTPAASAGWRLMRPFSRQAMAVSFHAGDEITAMNGHAVTHFDSIARFIDAREGRRSVLVLRGPDGKTYARSLTWSAANIRTWFRGSGLDPWRLTLARRLTYDLMTLLLLLPATILFLRRSHEIVAASFAVGLCLFSVGSTLEYWKAVDLLGVYRIADALPYILVLIVGFAFPDGRYWPSWTRFAIVAVPVVYVPLAFNSVYYGSFGLLTAPAFVAMIALLMLRYRQLRAGPERQQLRWVAFGIAAGVLTLLLRVVLVPLQASLPPAPASPWVDYFASFVHALGFALIGSSFAIALLKLRLYDAESFIGRSAALTATALMLAGVWAASEKAIEAALTGVLGQGQESFAAIVSAGLAVALITPLHGRVHGWIERRFRNSVWRLKETLPGKIAALSLRTGTDELCRIVLTQIAHAVRATRAALVIDRTDGLTVAAHHDIAQKHVSDWLAATQLPEHGDAVEEESLFPFRLSLGEEDKATAWLLVGPRPDGTPCNRDEREALAELVAPLGRALATIEAREQREQRLEARLALIEARLRAAE